MSGIAPMKLYRLRLQPLAPWITPWQSDTLAGLLCCTAARSRGAVWLSDAILAPALRGEPPFVLSDAFPGEMLPMPVVLRARDWGEDSRKAVKRARWLRPEAFARARNGQLLGLADVVTDNDLYCTNERLRNALDRVTGTTGDASLFSTTESALNEKHPDLGTGCPLSVYARINSGFEQRFLELFQAMALSGFGADATAGRGAFDVVSGLEPMDELATIRPDMNAFSVLSTYQPAASDPTDGYWELLTKHGKLGPDFGIENVFKRPLVMLRPGATFRGTPSRDFVGRAIPMADILPTEVVHALQNEGALCAHLAFGLCVPFRFRDEEVA